MPTGLSAYYVMNVDYSFTPPANYSPPAGSNFDTNVMNRTPAQASARRAEAVNYFLSQFGVDFSSSNTAQGGKLMLFHTMNDPNWNTRTIYSGGQEVPAAGWKTYEGRWFFSVVDTSATLYGAWGGAGGTNVPRGTTALYGEWLIEYEIPCVSTAAQTGDIYMSFKTERPVFPDYLGRGSFEFVVSRTPGTDGVATGLTDLRSDPNVPGNLRVLSKTIVRFE